MVTTLIFPLLMMCSCLSAGLQEVWEDGLAFRELSAQSRDIAEQRDGIEAERKVRLMQSRGNRDSWPPRCAPLSVSAPSPLSAVFARPSRYVRTYVCSMSYFRGE